uniref:DUF7627 domain-containing protein n=1 Tax=Parastrongyloides trichosuri TaxID=131310 RepID=A0A0N4ZBW8_PARTI
MATGSHDNGEKTLENVNEILKGIDSISIKKNIHSEKKNKNKRPERALFGSIRNGIKRNDDQYDSSIPDVSFDKLNCMLTEYASFHSNISATEFKKILSKNFSKYNDNQMREFGENCVYWGCHGYETYSLMTDIITQLTFHSNFRMGCADELAVLYRKYFESQISDEEDDRNDDSETQDNSFKFFPKLVASLLAENWPRHQGTSDNEIIYTSMAIFKGLISDMKKYFEPIDDEDDDEIMDDRTLRFCADTLHQIISTRTKGLYRNHLYMLTDAYSVFSKALIKNNPLDEGMRKRLLDCVIEMDKVTNGRSTS